MKLKIISGGTPATTKVVNADTGEPVHGVSRLEIVCDAQQGCSCVITVNNCQLEIEADEPVFVSENTF